jgi:hypothetical protein
MFRWKSISKVVTPNTLWALLVSKKQMRPHLEDFNPIILLGETLSVNSTVQHFKQDASQFGSSN